MVNGQVFNPTAVSYRPGHSAKWYLSQAGGVNTACGQKSRLRDSRRRVGARREKQQHWLVGWRSHERGVASGRHDRCPGKSAKDRRSQLGVDHAISANGFVCSFGSGVHPSVTKDDFLMQMKLIVLVIGCAASSLTLTAISSVCAPPQAQEQRPVDAKESSSDAEASKMASTKKIASGLELEPFREFKTGPHRIGKAVLGGPKSRFGASPAKVRFSDAQWLVPVSGITAGLFVTDSDFSRHLSQNPTTINHYKSLSNAGLGALIGGAGGMWLLGHVRHNEHWSETGFLAGEAVVNSLVAVE